MSDLASRRSWLRLHGARPWHEVLRAQAAAHATVSASIHDNVQVALLESLAMGVPVVATGVGEAIRYLAPPLDGLCVAPGGTEAFAAAIERLRREYAQIRALVAERARDLRVHHDESRVAAAVRFSLSGA
jgi:glycosyltransferase involved in cell wall biosynthesis